MRSFLSIRVDPLSLGVGGLLGLDHHRVSHDASVSLLHLAVFEDLLPSLVLQLHGIHLLLLGDLLLFEILLAELDRTLMHDCLRLSFSLALEVIGLDAVRSEHRDFRLLILGHEIVVRRIFDLDSLSLLVHLLSDDLTLDFLPGENHVDVLSVGLVLFALSNVLVLRRLQLAVVTEGHLIVGFGLRLLSSFLVSLLRDLLLAPILLLQLLHAHTISEALVLTVENA